MKREPGVSPLKTPMHITMTHRAIPPLVPIHKRRVKQPVPRSNRDNGSSHDYFLSPQRTAKPWVPTTPQTPRLDLGNDVKAGLDVVS